MAKRDDSRDWKKASEQCLVLALNKAKEALEDGQIERLKATESLIKTVADVVGASIHFGTRRPEAQASRGSDDDD